MTPEQIAAKEVSKAGSTVIMYGLIATIGSIASIVLGAMAFSAKKKLIGILLIVISAAAVFTNYVLAVSIIAGILVTLGTKPEIAETPKQ